jgi:transcriptional regulator of acetoin/glycerol metabolism
MHFATDHADRIQAVVEGRAPAEDALEVSSSWDRCLLWHHIDPARHARAHVLTTMELQRHREPLEGLIRAGADELDRLQDIVGHGHYAVLLCDPQGVIVDHRVSPVHADAFEEWGLYTGGLFSEELEGTNGIGTAIAEKRTVTVHGRQHFRTQYTTMSCSCAPILDADGRMIAVVDVTGLDPTVSERSHGLAAALVNATARAIEKRLAEEPAKTPSLFSAHRGGLPPVALKRVQSYIQSHLAERVSIEQLAAVAGLSAFHFARAFKQSEGTTPHEYLVDRRVAHACALLKETDTPLSEIALASGFADQSHFARQFKKRVGISPRLFRQSERYRGAVPVPLLCKLAT